METNEDKILLIQISKAMEDTPEIACEIEIETSIESEGEAIIRINDR